MRFSILLFGMVQALRVTARLYAEFADRLKQKNFTAQFKLQDGSEGRWVKFENGRIKSRKGICEKPEHMRHEAGVGACDARGATGLRQIGAREASRDQRGFCGQRFEGPHVRMHIDAGEASLQHRSRGLPPLTERECLDVVPERALEAELYPADAGEQPGNLPRSRTHPGPS